jgi:hypothetical protein
MGEIMNIASQARPFAAQTMTPCSILPWTSFGKSAAIVISSIWSALPVSFRTRSGIHRSVPGELMDHLAEALTDVWDQLKLPRRDRTVPVTKPRDSRIHADSVACAYLGTDLPYPRAMAWAGTR